MSFESGFPQPHTPVESEAPSRRTEFGFEDHTAEDIELLLDSSKNLYEYGLALEDAARHSEALDTDASGLLDRMNDMLTTLEGFRDEAPLSEERYGQMVDTYEELKASVRTLEGIYADFINDEESTDDEPENAEGTEAVVANEEVTVDVVETAPNDEIPPESDEAVAESSEKVPSPEAVAHLQERASDLVDEVVFTRDRLYSLFPREARDDDTMTLLKELDVSQSRAEKLKRDLEGSDDQEYFERMQEEIRDNVAAIDAGLQRLKDALDAAKGVSTPDEAGIEEELTVEAEAEPISGFEAVSPAVDAVDSPASDAPAEDETPHPARPLVSSYEVAIDRIDSNAERQDSAETADMVPDEAEVATLMRAVTENQFYTEEERTTAQSLYERYHRSVAEGQPLNILRRNYVDLHEFVTNLSERPSAEYAEARADRIIERIEAGKTASNASTVETAKAMREMIARIAADPEKTEDDVILAYRNLERFATENEREWITIAGMHVPPAGPDGVFGARSFREGLMLVRDKHKEFQRHPRKRLLVDKIVRMLMMVPKEGLSTEQTEEITRLMREIDVPDGIVGNRATDEDIAMGQAAEKKVAEEKAQQGAPKVESATSSQSEAAESKSEAPLKMTTVHGVIVPVAGEAKPEFVRPARKGLIELADTWKGDEERARQRVFLERMIKITQEAANDVLKPEQTAELATLVEQLRAVEKSAAVEEEPVRTERTSRTLDITTDDEPSEGDIPLTIKRKGVEAPVTEQVGSEPASDDDIETVVERPVTAIPEPADAAALDAVEQQDPVNQAVPSERPTVRTWQERRSENLVVPMDGLREEYPFFFEKVDAAELDKVIRYEVAAHERKYVDSIDEWVGVKRRSAFDYLKEMKLSELDAMVEEYGAANRDRFLNDTNVVYDAAISWYDQIGEMSRLVETSDDMTFGDLFARYIIEQEIR